MTQAQTTHRAEIENGPAVVDGELRYLSASTITKGDHRSFGGCLRAWFYRYVVGLPDRATASQALGTRVHSEIEEYLRTGRSVLGPLALQAKHCIPKPGDGLLVEHALEPGVLTCAGVPVVGHIDLVSFRGVNVGANDFGDVNDPPGTIEIRDWKTTSDFRYAKTGDELRSTVQMITYGAYATRQWDPTFVRLTHVYIRTRGARAPALNRSTRMHPDEIRSEWEQIEGVGRQIAQAARIPAGRVDDVDANTRSCGAFGGCPHRSYCKAANHNSLATFLGDDLAAELLADETEEQEGSPMSLLDLLPDTNTPAAPADEKAAIEKRLAELAALEKAAAEQAAREAAAKLVPPGFADAVDAIKRAVHNGQPVGFPPLGGEAAKAYAALRGIPLEGAGYAGSGQIGNTPVVSTTDAVIAMAKRLIDGGKVPARSADESLAKVAAAADAPAKTETAETPAPKTAEAPALGILPPDAPASNPATATAGPKDPAAQSSTAGVGGGPVTDGKADAGPAIEPVKKGRGGRPKKQVDGGATSTPDTSEGLAIYVNAIPSAEFTSLESYIREVVALLCKEHGLLDPRLAPPDHALGYGRWKAAVSLIAQRKPPPADRYVVVNPDELAECVLAGLRAVADIYVQGVR